MTNLKEWLNTKTFEYKQAACMFGHSEWIEIPKGAEVAVHYKYTDKVFFWKDKGKTHWGESSQLKLDWYDCETNMFTKLNEFLDEWDDEATMVWQREQDEPFLTPECTLNDQYAEIEQARQTIKASWPSIDMQRIENVAKAAKAVADSWPSIVAGAKANTEIHETVKAKPDFNFGAAQESGGEKDNVNHPSHYTQGKVECIDALESATIGKSGIEAVCVANVIKYLWRYEDKGGLESILKAKWYLDKLIECKK